MNTQLIINYLTYLQKRKSIFKVHSPFVYDFYSKVINDKQSYDAYEQLKKHRELLYSNPSILETVDFGSNSGYKEFTTYNSPVNKLAKQRSLGQKEAELLFRIVNYFKPNTILELGTAFGMSTSALALGNPNARIVTLEGCASVSSVAESCFNTLNINNVELIIGNFNNVLVEVLDSFDSIDFSLVDGNHRKIPTIDYFNHIKTKITENSIIIFDDIHWSTEMDEAWMEIKENKEVTISIDLFDFGIVFFRKGIEKQHFVLKI